MVNRAFLMVLILLLLILTSLVLMVMKLDRRVLLLTSLPRVVVLILLKLLRPVRTNLRRIIRSIRPRKLMTNRRPKRFLMSGMIRNLKLLLLRSSSRFQWRFLKQKFMSVLIGRWLSR